MKHVVITGSSSGIGRAAVQDLVAHGYHVFGSVRRQTDATELQSQLGQNFTPLLFDITDEAAVQAAADKVSDLLDGQGLSGLVNNAGIGGGGPLMHQPLTEVQRMFEINVLGALRVTQAFLPLLGARFPQLHPPGRLVNISSIAGRIALPFLGAYAGSKHALEALSDSLRRELALYGIDVIVIEPGSVKTPIWERLEREGFANKYVDTHYGAIGARFEKWFIKRGQAGIPADMVARTIRHALESDRPKARYVLPDHPIRGWLMPRLLPDRWLDRLIVSQVRLKQRKDSQ